MPRNAEDMDIATHIYWDTLRHWLDEYPLDTSQKKTLKKHLSSPQKEDHLGAVNELSCWKFLQNGYEPTPIPRKKYSTPDFIVKNAISEFFVEVSTLNTSHQDKAKFESGVSVELNHDETLRRLLGKFTEEKKQQLLYAAKRKTPAVLALYDYTTWSDFATQFFRYLADFLLGDKCGFNNLPTELSALIYIEQKFIEENKRFGISRIRSSIYYNPNAKYPLPIGTLPLLNQFSDQPEIQELESQDYWIWL